MLPDLGSTGLWLLSNAVGMLAFAGLLLLIILVEGRHRAIRLLAAACGVNMLWFALLTAAPLIGLAGPVLDLAETVRTGIWLALAAWLVPEPASGRLTGVLRSVSVAMPSALLLFLLWRAASAPLSGSPLFGHSFIFACGATAMAFWGLVLVEQTWRSTDTDARWAVKYLCLAMITLFGYDFLMYSFSLLYARINLSVWEARGAVNALVVPLIAIAALRNASWAVRVGVSHQAVFRTGAILFAGIYLLLVAVGSYYIRRFAGSWGEVLAVFFLTAATLGLLVILSSGQVRARIRVSLGKHLFRYKYDYRREWLALTSRLSQRHGDINAYERALRAVAQLVDSPAGALWVVREHEYQCVANWNLAAATEIVEPADTQLIAFFEETGWIVDCEELMRDPAHYGPLVLPAWLDAIDRAQFIVPLFAEKRLLGFVLLTVPRAAYRLGWEELDLLKTVGRQVGVFVDQQESNQALAEARQFEAFNRLTAFLMHDLKNIAGQQSLIVQNAQRHRHNPEFVDDMILTVENSVDRMQRLLAQLQRVSTREIHSRLVKVELVLAKLCQELAIGQPAPEFTQPAQSLYVRVDPDRFEMVLRHIIRNAQDATPPSGEVVVEAASVGTMAEISVRDTGEGMTAAFVRESLFQPFVSTKSARGMGIGAHQTREFARGAGGDVRVESVPGQGTTFTIVLPIARPEDDNEASEGRVS
ncbi:MAG: PEP-CTERM system histidine kinase PrsK [Salinisphaera sp.]|nr:PEP-CTERM system histidine kinase PrsK [Salinisphaera sp.]